MLKSARYFSNTSESMFDLAKYCGVSLCYISAIANQRANLPVDLAIKICAYSKGKLYLGDLCPYIKDYLPFIARHQLQIEQQRNLHPQVDLIENEQIKE